LLRTLTSWESQGCEVSLRNADALVDKTRVLIQPGRRDDDDTAWRLLMALLWLMQATTDYESTCIDYCITYEVSPPSPQSRPAPLHHVKPDRSEQAFLMPAAIEIPVDALLAAINADAECHERLVLDCAGLRR